MLAKFSSPACYWIMQLTEEVFIGTRHPFCITLAVMLNHLSLADKNTSTSASTSNDPERLIVKTTEVLRGRTEIWIEHGTEMYRLRLTRAGKLLLSK
jgi:hemin uptake protein HemP